MDNKPAPDLGSIIKNARDSKNWTQEQLHEKSGISVRNIQRIETGETKHPQEYTLRRLASALELDVNALLKNRKFSGTTKPKQKLKDDFKRDKSIPSESEIPMNIENPLSNEEAESTHEQNKNDGTLSQPQHSQQYNKNTFLGLIQKRWTLYASISFFLVAVIIAAFLIKYINYNNSEALFQGAWVSPKANATVQDVVYFSAYAAPVNQNGEKVDYVTFTAWWPSVNPNLWVKLCYAYTPNSKGIFGCTANLRQEHAHAGSIRLSFDIYDKYGHATYAPDSEFDIHYLPSSLATL